MEKIVKDGLRDCTVILDGSECAVRFDTCFRAFAVRNDGAADVFISKTSGIVPDADGVMCVKSGSSAVFAHMDIYADTVYLLGNGRVQVHAQNDSANPFNFAPTLDGGVTASGNPVQMDGLQGGVPFAEMVVSGKNLIPFPYSDGESKTVNGITFTVNSNGSITANGTATANAIFYIKSVNDTKFMPKNVKVGTAVTLSGVNSNNEGVSLRSVFYFSGNATNDTFVDNGESDTKIISSKFDHIAIYVRIAANTTVDNAVIYPQLELGSTPTEYEPPITGRNIMLTVNGTETTITPTSNPYIIPNDIRQVEGLNNISVSEGELSVVGVRKNAAIKRIWDEIDEIKTAIIVSNGESE